jgi:hypothetical protein
MSFSDKPSVDRGRAWGCLLIGGIIALIEFGLLIGAAMGDCVGECPPSDRYVRLAMFPGSLLIAIPLMILVTRWAMKQKQND